MSTIVFEAYKKYLMDKREKSDAEYAKKRAKRGWSKGTLWSSDLGKCHRAAILRVTGTTGQDFVKTSGLDYMNTGVITEDETLAALQYVYGDRLTDQVELRYNMWSGKADFGIDIGTDKPILIEHKTTSEKNFGTDNSTKLPKKEHIGQAISYMWMYEQLYGVTPDVYLFYKAWGNFGEFQLERENETIRITGNINGVVMVEDFDYDVYGEIRELSRWYHSAELPPVLDKKYKGCTFMGKPSCQFYNKCWGNE